ncbi:hypothetical protein SKAU_G00295780 [Synaphobranchus kaupii]|uniref:Uncharacterized protein n=1 Tax=Synaphobranchus kaupii TaxID=118154 RepID=A0A9Q1IKM1_SYNKA|nr:hypothetical protein SKAU_G00295780 [Synaphobranchus kaupii]
MRKSCWFKPSVSTQCGRTCSAFWVAILCGCRASWWQKKRLFVRTGAPRAARPAARPSRSGKGQGSGAPPGSGGHKVDTFLEFLHFPERRKGQRSAGRSERRLCFAGGGGFAPEPASPVARVAGTTSVPFQPRLSECLDCRSTSPIKPGGAGLDLRTDFIQR